MSKKKQEPRLETPLKWAVALGHYRKHGRGAEARKMLSADYAAANVLYGWADQAHHYGPDSFRLSQEDFEVAIEAAGQYPAKPPHPPAVPKVREARFKKQAFPSQEN
jgi:hypothetical protein